MEEVTAWLDKVRSLLERATSQTSPCPGFFRQAARSDVIYGHEHVPSRY